MNTHSEWEQKFHEAAMEYRAATVQDAPSAFERLMGVAVSRAHALTLPTISREARVLPMMRNAFRVTEVSGDPDPAKQSFAMRFSFPSIEALHAADDEWNKFIAAAQADAREGLTFDQWWSVGGWRLVSQAGAKNGWRGAAEAGYIGGLFSVAASASVAEPEPERKIDAQREGGGITQRLIHQGEAARSVSKQRAALRRAIDHAVMSDREDDEEALRALLAALEGGAA
ncbi:hypothetical protein LGM14_25975 [Burkholderia multivorans]|uniref:hypothetical protein n=1 Tax=Burkholderia multivorans TaxID=87883 RepID=UPI0021C178B5|nr:hypothetical protein [Burkholderia multivorans]MCA7960956.1 hypothetical protein [Burkholderia multivorans]